jgi:hypothetical protein
MLLLNKLKQYANISGNHFVNHKVTKAQSSNGILVLDDVYVGVEVEFQNLPVAEMYHWTEVDEPSVRENGNEYVLKQPLRGAALVAALKSLDLHVLSRMKQRPERHLDANTSLHVHLDVRFLTHQEFYALTDLSVLLEKALFSVARGVARRSSPFCIPMECNNAFRWLQKCMYQDEHPLSYTAIKMLREYGTKYSGIAFNSVVTQGSIEFRMHPGTVQVSEILEWINVLLSLVKEAKRVAANPPARAIIDRMVFGKIAPYPAALDMMRAYLLRWVPKSLAAVLTKEDILDGMGLLTYLKTPSTLFDKISPFAEEPNPMGIRWADDDDDDEDYDGDEL